MKLVHGLDFMGFYSCINAAFPSVFLKTLGILVLTLGDSDPEDPLTTGLNLEEQPGRVVCGSLFEVCLGEMESMS